MEWICSQNVRKSTSAKGVPRKKTITNTEVSPKAFFHAGSRNARSLARKWRPTRKPGIKKGTALHFVEKARPQKATLKYNHRSLVLRSASQAVKKAQRPKQVIKLSGLA